MSEPETKPDVVSGPRGFPESLLPMMLEHPPAVAPRNDNVLVKKITRKDVGSSSIDLSMMKDSRDNQLYHMVVAVGPKVADIKPGKLCIVKSASTEVVDVIAGDSCPFEIVTQEDIVMCET